MRSYVISSTQSKDEFDFIVFIGFTSSCMFRNLALYPGLISLRELDVLFLNKYTRVRGKQRA